MQKLFRLAVNVFIIHHFLCCYGYSCGVLSSIHLDLGCTHTRGSDPCLSPKVQFISQVWLLCTVSSAVGLTIPWPAWRGGSGAVHM